MLNHVVVVFDDGEVVQGVISGCHNDNGGGIYLLADGAELPAKRKFSEMTSITVTA
jgi:hypothetical protein